MSVFCHNLNPPGTNAGRTLQANIAPGPHAGILDDEGNLGVLPSFVIIDMFENVRQRLGVNVHPDMRVVVFVQGENGLFADALPRFNDPASQALGDLAAS